MFVNEHYAGDVETPFGGFKKCGIGREKGVDALLHYTQVKCVTVKLWRCMAARQRRALHLAPRTPPRQACIGVIAEVAIGSTLVPVGGGTAPTCVHDCNASETVRSKPGSDQQHPLHTRRSTRDTLHATRERQQRAGCWSMQLSNI